MQSLPADITIVGMVQKVSRNRMANCLHMDTDLMRTACLKGQGKQRQIRVFVVSERPVVCDSAFPACNIGDPFNRGTGFSGNREGDRAAAGRPAAYDGKIFPVD